MASGSKEVQNSWRVVVVVASFGDAGEFLGHGHDGRLLTLHQKRPPRHNNNDAILDEPV